MNKNYLVLARKYRPLNFADLKGQDFVITTIINAIKLNRVAHTILLTGIRGSGKTTTARIIAKTLNCSSPIIEEKLVVPCGVCNNCQSSFAGKHPDIIELDAASRTGVNDAREIIENSNYLPLLGKYKIFIIDEVHMLSTSAFNALLKTLEEPPEHVKFIFATTELRKIPITILSRCQKFELKRLNNEQLVAHLQDILIKEEVEASEDALKLIAVHAEGSVRDSLSLLDLVIANANKQQITKAMVMDLLGFSNNTKVILLFKAIIAGLAIDALKAINDFYYEGKDLVQVFQQFLELVHNISKSKLNANTSDFAYSNEELKEIEALANNCSIATLTIIWQMILKGINEMRISNNQLIAAEMLIIRLCHLSNIPTPTALIEKIESGSLGEFAENTNSLVHAISHKPKLSINNFEELTQLFHHHREMLLYQYLVNDVHLIEFEPLKIKVRHTNSVPLHFVKKVMAFLEEWTGDKWSILVASEEGSPTLSTQAEETKLKQIEQFKQHELVKDILTNFPSAEVKDIIKH